MGVYKIRAVTGPNEKTFYRRLSIPRESFVDMGENNKIVLKAGSTKWKDFTSRSEPSYVKVKKGQMSGLVFENRTDAEAFLKKHKPKLNKLVSNNPTHKRFEVFSVTKKFMPETSTMKFWNK